MSAGHDGQTQYLARVTDDAAMVTHTDFTVLFQQQTAVKNACALVCTTRKRL